MAATLGRRFYVEHIFNKSYVSFAPYDVPPPEAAWRRGNASVLPRHSSCPSFPENEAFVIIYGGDDLPPNRACAWVWRTRLCRLRRALRLTDDDALLGAAAEVYGCALRRFVRPTKALAARIPVPPRPHMTDVGIHVRSGDASFSGKCRVEDHAETAREAAAVVATHPDPFVRIESDNLCARKAMAAALSSRAVLASYTYARPTHWIAPGQLAAWFGLSRSQHFIVSPTYKNIDAGYAESAHVPEGDFEKYATRFRGFWDHGLLRLSSWSVMAALRAGGSTSIHVLCHKPPRHGWKKLQVETSHSLAPAYACSSRAALALTSELPNVAPSTNAHFADPHANATQAQWWGVANFV